MHKLPSSETLRGFRVASLLVLAMVPMIPLAVGFGLCGVLFGEHRWFVFSAVAAGVGLSCMAASFLMAGRLRCPLCIMPPLRNQPCSKHRGAVRLLGSHRLEVARSVIFKGSFRCPYCGEPTAMQVRERRRG